MVTELTPNRHETVGDHGLEVRRFYLDDRLLFTIVPGYRLPRFVPADGVHFESRPGGGFAIVDGDGPPEPLLDENGFYRVSN